MELNGIDCLNYCGSHFDGIVDQSVLKTIIIRVIWDGEGMPDGSDGLSDLAQTVAKPQVFVDQLPKTSTTFQGRFCFLATHY